MIKNGLKILVILSIFISVSCERFDDTVLIVQVINRADSSIVEDVEIYVVKRKPAFIYGYKKVEAYQGFTDNHGICKIVIDNYNRDKYDYSIDVNNHSGNTPPDFGGYTYSIYSTVLEEYELSDTLKVRLTRIPFPSELGN